MNRRTFLKVLGMGSLSFAAGCKSKPEKALYSFVEAPSDLITGVPTFYASTCRECPAGCGILAKNREGRVIKVEGNPFHPINKGSLCMRGQSVLQGLYNPDRLKGPLLKKEGRWVPLPYPQAISLLKNKIEEAVKKGENRVLMITEAIGEATARLLSESMMKWGSVPPLVFEAFGYENLKAANQCVFGIRGLPSYRLDQCDFLVSFGADFLETWISPVEYAWKFKEMHAFQGDGKALFFYVGPYETLTGANADSWLACLPGSQCFLALGLIRSVLSKGRGRQLPAEVLSLIRRIVAPYTKQEVCRLSKISLQDFEALTYHLLKSRRPLVLGGGSAASGPNAYAADVAVNLLNLILDFELTLFDFQNRHRIETASKRSQVLKSFKGLQNDEVDLLFLNNVNPLFLYPQPGHLDAIFQKTPAFVVSFNNFMDETARAADLVFPVSLPLESWDEYGGKKGLLSTIQPCMKTLTGAPHLCDVFIEISPVKHKESGNFKKVLLSRWITEGKIKNEKDWVKILERGGLFEPSPEVPPRPMPLKDPTGLEELFSSISPPVQQNGPLFVARPSIRFFDGRGANRPWLCEIPDPLTKVAWQTPALLHRKTLGKIGLENGEVLEIQTQWGRLEAPAYLTEHVLPGLVVMDIGQGHLAYGRYARGMGSNPFSLLPPEPEPVSGGPVLATRPISIRKTGRREKLAHTDGSQKQFGRKIALSIGAKALGGAPAGRKERGLSMDQFPLTLPLPQGYSRRRDFYPSHSHVRYRWAMVVDLERCIGCGACASACYAENNLGVVGLQRILEQREMSWLRIERYRDSLRKERILFLPMLCQHCDNAPCESVCPVYAPHHSKEGLNNQIYNRCIGTRFCSQNCPYKVRRFNWFDWEWPEPLNLQLNPDVTVRSKGVMEKCSFCVQRIKEAHSRAKDEKREILDGEVQPACAQTCPTRALVFGNLMDEQSQVRKRVQDDRAYQVMGYLNTKPAVVYLKKVIWETA